MLYFTLPEDSSNVDILSIIQTGACHESGVYKLCNVLPINTRYWKREQVGSIKFVCPPEHAFNHQLAERMSRFIDSLAAAWHLAVVPVEYYFADDIDRVAKALGFDYWPGEGNTHGARGFVDFGVNGSGMSPLGSASPTVGDRGTGDSSLRPSDGASGAHADGAEVLYVQRAVGANQACALAAFRFPPK